MDNNSLMENHDVDYFKHNRFDTLSKSYREASHDTKTDLMMEKLNSWNKNKVSCLNNMTTLNPIIEDPSKEDLKSDESNDRRKESSANPFFSNDDLKTPTTIDYSTIQPLSPIQSKIRELSERKDKEIKVSGVSRSLNSSTKHTKKNSLNSVLALEKECKVKLETSKRCNCFSVKICTIV